MGIVIACLSIQKQNECYVDLKRDHGHLIGLLNVQLKLLSVFHTIMM